MGKSKKTPRYQQAPAAVPKNPQLKNQPPNGKVVWSFEILDVGGPWCPALLADEHRETLFSKIKEYSSRTWGEIESARDRDHGHEIEDLSPRARERLAEIRQDDAAMIWRFRFGGKERLWGIRDQNIMRVLWWDPEHEVYQLKA